MQNEKSSKLILYYLVTIPKLQRQAAEASAYAAGRKRELNILDEDKLDKRYEKEQSSIVV